MTVRIKVAQTTDELDAVFRLRHRVFIEDGGYMAPHADMRLYDRYDAFPTSVNIIAVVDERAVGTIRYMEKTSAGTSAEEYFDYSAFLPANARVGAVTLAAVEPEYRKTPRLTFALFAMGYYWAASRGITHILASANPERRESFLKSGYEIVAPIFHHDHKEVDVLPMILELASLEDRFLTFVKTHDLHHWLNAFERQFHAAGETIIKKGEGGDTAYVVIDGRAAVVRDKAGAPNGREVMAEFGPGELFGELALLTSRARTATVVAQTDLDLMVLEREAFQRQLHERPDAALKMLELLANRMAVAAERMTER